MAEQAAFIAHRTPRVPAGDYAVTVTQDVSLEGGTPPSVTRAFTVASERFVLPASAVRATFPPDGALGDHTTVLPHIVLDRPSLPWQRSAGVAGAPWLAVLVFCGDEQPEVKTVTVGDLAGGAAHRPALTAESHEQDTDPVNVIDVARSVLADLVPPADDLGLLAHVRPRPDGDVAVVIGRRLPESGASSTAHLVSVEGRYGPGGFDLGPDGDGATVRLVTLARWSFACLSKEHTFPYLARSLADRGAPFRLPASGDAGADGFLAEGFVPAPHLLRQGGRTVSWYRGPLVTGPAPAARAAGGADGTAARRAVRSADGRLRYHPGTGMLDTSYAAAWQLGRLLTLQHTAVATELAAWKRRRAQALRRTVPADHPLLVPAIDEAVPVSVAALLADLAALQGVPFRYLVPDERLLPAESIRFFHVDGNWVDALVDGAFSIGRLTSADAEADAAGPPGPGGPPAVAGAIIRSRLVADYPDLRVDAYRRATDDDPLEPALILRPMPDILLCGFAEVFDRLDLHQPVGAQHIGVEVPAAGQVSKPGIDPLPLGPRSTVPVAALARALGAPSSAELAARLTESAERVTFLRG